jgi:hypothetical protein
MMGDGKADVAARVFLCPSYFSVSREEAGEFSECMHDMDRARIGHGEGGLSKVYRQHTYSIASTHIQ